MNPQIKVIIDIIECKRDINGNCYYFSRITNVMTGKYLIFYSEYENHMIHVIQDVLNLEYNEIHISNATIPIRQFGKYIKEQEKHNKDTFYANPETMKRLINELFEQI